MTQESMNSNFTSMHPTVEFLDIMDLYSFNADLCCKYKFNDYTPQEGDRVAIFKIGWSHVKDYIVFEWAPVNVINGQGSVTLNRHILPKNSTEVYQICYISSESELHGASTPFQFYSDEKLVGSSYVSTSKSSGDTISKSHMVLEQKDQEIAKLKEENLVLKETLKALLPQNQGSMKNYDEDIQELKELTQSLKSMLLEHEKELDMLKSKITQGGEEYKKLYLEKVKVERKYEKLKNRSERPSLLKEVKPMNNDIFDIGDLKSIPPFPSMSK